MPSGSSTASSRAGCGFPRSARFPREAHLLGIGEDILLLARAHELLDGLAVLAQREAQRGFVAAAAALLDMQVERLHAPLDIDVADYQLAAVELDERGAFGLQLLDQRGVEALDGQRDARVF